MAKEAAGAAGGRTAAAFELGLALSYPLVVHLGLWTESLPWTAGLLGACLLCLVLLPKTAPSPRAPWRLNPRVLRSLFAVGALLAAAAALFDGEKLLLFFPLLSSAALFFTFASSLGRERSLVETFARLWEPELSPEKVRYCRRVTVVWSAFFGINGLAALALALWAPLHWWTLYTGLLGYVLAGLLGFSELVVRVRRFGLATAGPLGRLLMRNAKNR